MDEKTTLLDDGHNVSFISFLDSELKIPCSQLKNSSQSNNKYSAVGTGTLAQLDSYWLHES